MAQESTQAVAVAEAAATARQKSIFDHPTTRFLLKRFRQLIISVFILITATFLMLQLIPGDPVRNALGPTAPPEIVEAQRALMGLDKPLLQQYVDFIFGIFRGDLGVSLSSKVPVTDIIATRLPATLQIVVPAYILTFAAGIPIGVFMARFTRNSRRPKSEVAFTTSSVVVQTTPDFILTVAFIALFSITLGWLPAAGRSGPDSYIIPILALAIGPIFFIARLIRLDMLRVLGLDYIRAARSKRIGVARTYFRHALPNALTATLTVAGLALGSLLAGSVLVETVLSWPGLGTEMVSGITLKNYPVVQGVILVYGAMILALNLIVDLIIMIIDPRVTFDGGAA